MAGTWGNGGTGTKKSLLIELKGKRASLRQLKRLTGISKSKDDRGRVPVRIDERPSFVYSLMY